jgi:dipeptidyl aminopeptidase/acylaminoacyl peptidase
MRHRIAALALSGIAIAFPGAAHAQATRLLALDDLARTREVSDPQRSPDGAWVAYVVTVNDFDKDARDSDIWMASWDGTRQVRLTSSPESESRPRWSPDGRYLAFTASRGEEEEKKKGAQVWLLDRSGGEAQKLTDVKGNISEYAWSPDGKRLVLAVDDLDPSELAEKKKDGKPATKPPVVIDRYHFKQDRLGYLGVLRTHLYLFDLERRAIETLTSGVWDEASPEWSPDGRWIAFVSRRGPDPDRSTNSDIWLVEATAGAAPRQLTTSTNPDGGRPAWSPDGAFIAYLQGDEPRFYAYNQNRLAIVPVAGGVPRVLTASLDRTVSSPEWAPDGKSLFVTVEDDRAQYVARVPVGGGTLEPLTSGRRVVRDPSIGPDGAAAVLAATAAEPFEVHALENGQLRRLSRQNDAWLKTVQLATVEDFTAKAKDGTVVNGLIFKPPSFVPGTRYPTLLYIHGGPNGQDEHSFDFEGQWLAANGYVVLEVNYRGSAGRGSAYQKAIFADWGHLEVVDLLAGVDYAIAQGIADPARLGIGGWSYGGILTNYTIATDPRFKAAVSGASSSLQTTMFGVDQYIVQYEAELGPPWKNPDGWMKVSYPFFHADRIRTPTLFLGGEKDFNVPIAGVEQMYQALRTQNVDTQLVIYPGQFHGLTTPSYLRDRLQRYVAWYDKYLKPKAASPTAQAQGSRLNAKG